MGDELNETGARLLAQKLFGPSMMIFRMRGLWHVGRYLDSGRDSTGREVRLPHARRQEVFGVGRTLREAFQFALGPTRVYSISGLAPAPRRGTGYVPVFDEYCRLIGYSSPEGLFSPRFPSFAGLTQ